MYQYHILTYSAVCTTYVRNSPRGEESVDRILFLDDKTMEVKWTYELEGFEKGASCLSCLLAESADSSHMTEFVVVGTAFALHDEQQPSRGRILIFGHGPDGAFRVVAETVTKGAVFSLASLHDRIVAGVDSKVCMLSCLPFFNNYKS
jgi:DNA damage-binding protein 1